jgi:hypothetical protein
VQATGLGLGNDRGDRGEVFLMPADRRREIGVIGKDVLYRVEGDRPSSFRQQGARALVAAGGVRQVRQEGILERELRAEEVVRVGNQIIPRRQHRAPVRCHFDVEHVAAVPEDVVAGAADTRPREDDKAFWKNHTPSAFTPG